jgi:hypothetical protein
LPRLGGATGGNGKVSPDPRALRTPWRAGCAACRPTPRPLSSNVGRAVAKAKAATTPRSSTHGRLPAEDTPADDSIEALLTHAYVKANAASRSRI